MRLLAPLASDLRLPLAEAPLRWFRARLIAYALIVAAVTVLAFGLLLVLRPGGEGGGSMPEGKPTQTRDQGFGNDVPLIPVDDAMLVAGGLDSGRFIMLPVSGPSVIDGAGKRVGALTRVVVGQENNIVGIVVRTSSGLFAGKKNVLVPASHYRFSNEGQLALRQPAKASQDVATIDLSNAQIDALPTIRSLGD
jgi:hypothetical protein